MTGTIQALSTLSVPYKDGRHVLHWPGDAIEVDDLAPHLQTKLEEDDPWTMSLFRDLPTESGTRKKK